jgi:hypothetical protein
LENEIVIRPLADALVDSVVGKADALLMEKEAQIAGEFNHLARFACGDVDDHGFLDPGAEAALGFLKGEAIKPCSDAGTDIRKGFVVDRCTVWRRSYEQAEMSGIPWIADSVSLPSGS